MLKEILLTVGKGQLAARSEAIADHPIGAFAKFEAPTEISEVLRGQYDAWKVKGSVGLGRWADVFWLAIFNPLITNSAQRGYYIVYLFHPNGQTAYLSLNQGATEIYQEFKSKARQVLMERAAFMKSRIPEYRLSTHIGEIQLGSSQRLPRGYEAGHIIGFSYDLNNLPSEEVLQRDLLGLCKAYATLEYRGGAEDLSELNVGDDQSTGSNTIEELRSYRVHRKLERNSKASKAVKKVQGCRCKACETSFAAVYGELGEGFIEAHHLKPLSSLEDGITTKYDVENDFTVLCANCHRMIHRLDDPSDLELLKEIICRNRE